MGSRFRCCSTSKTCRLKQVDGLGCSVHLPSSFFQRIFINFRSCQQHFRPFKVIHRDDHFFLKKIPHYTKTNVSLPTPLPLHPTPNESPGNRQSIRWVEDWQGLSWDPQNDVRNHSLLTIFDIFNLEVQPPF